MRDEISSFEPFRKVKWEHEADVVVVGYGGAGAIAAITAHDLGSKVLILEKTPRVNRTPPGFPFQGISGSISGGGGNTSMSGGHFVGPVDPVAGATYLYNGAWGATPMPVCKAWADRASKNAAWFDKMGIQYTVATLDTEAQEFPGLPGATSTVQIAVVGGGAGFFMQVDTLVRSRGIDILFNTPATSLIQNPQTKEIVGVTAISYPTPILSPTSVWKSPASGGTTINIKASKAVILCTGGFEYDEDMKLSYLKLYPIHYIGWIYNTGDGVKMAQKVGAGLWHMNAMIGGPNLWFPENEMAFLFGGPMANSFIYVDKYGKRYLNETKPFPFNLHNGWMLMTEFDLGVPEYSRIPSFMIFDETVRLAGPLGHYMNARTPMGAPCIPPELGGGEWSSDNSAEIAKGWIIRGETITGLANAINEARILALPPSAENKAPPSTLRVRMSPDVLNATVQSYNEYCSMKKDPDLRRDPRTLLQIQTPPFYAVPLWPGGPNTNGGPIRNEKAQVCDPDNKPIPRLYSAGELGSVFGFLYSTGGTNLGEVVAFGQIAGENAHAETPWT